MRHSTRLIADHAGLTDHDATLLEQAAPVLPTGSPPGPIHGFVTRHGQTVPFTLDTSQPMPEPRAIVPEQIALAALFIASFIGPLCHLLG